MTGGGGGSNQRRNPRRMDISRNQHGSHQRRFHQQQNTQQLRLQQQAQALKQLPVHVQLAQLNLLPQHVQDQLFYLLPQEQQQLLVLHLQQQQTNNFLLNLQEQFRMQQNLPLPSAPQGGINQAQPTQPRQMQQTQQPPPRHFNVVTGDGGGKGKNKRFSCHGCSFVGSLGKFMAHARGFGINKPFYCKHYPACTEKFMGWRSRDYHHKNKTPEHDSSDQPPKPISYPCNTCNKFFYQQHQLQRHMIKHSKEKPHGCNQCNKKYKYSWGLKQHQIDKHPPRQRRRPGHCNVLTINTGKSGRSGSNLFPCQSSECSFSDSAKEFMKHAQEYGIEKPFYCPNYPNCGVKNKHKFKRWQERDRHKRACDKCLADPNTNMSTPSAQIGQGFYHCQGCDEEFSSQEELNNHRCL